MDIDMYYWISEYGKVFCGYLFLMFLWPSVVFHRYLRKKSKTFRFSFCVIVPIVIMNTVVLGLGLIHGLNQSIVAVIFYGIFGLAFLRNMLSYLDRKYKKVMEVEFPDVRGLKGKYRTVVLVILFFLVCYRYMKKAAFFLSLDYIKKIKSCNWDRIRLRVKECIWNFGSMLNALFWKYGILVLVIVYGMSYFSYGAFQVHSYGYGDLYAHHAWISGLMDGDIFAAGIYPEGMHCFIYCMNALFGLRIYNILLFLQGIHVTVFLLSAYLLLRKIFCWRYTPELVLALFLTLDLSNADLIHSMFRLQITLPQEFGLYTVFLCALFLKQYLDKEPVADLKAKELKYYLDENLFLFMMGLAASIAIHFHAAIMTGIVCAAFAIVTAKKVFRGKRFFSLIAAVCIACVISATPMAGALMQGIPFNYSITWAVNTLDGSERRSIRSQQDGGTGNEVSIEGIWDKKNGNRSVLAYARKLLRKVYEEGYVVLYGSERARWIVAMTILVSLFCMFIGKDFGLEQMEKICAGYPPAILISVLYILFYAAPMIGLPDIIPEGRFFAPGHMMVIAVMVMDFDFLLSGLTMVCKEAVLCTLSLVSVLGVYGGAVLFGSFRGYLFYELTRYDAAVRVTNSIIDTFPEYSYTIVSPTDELYQIKEFGWHEELLSFVEQTSSGVYTIPSEYVFIYVEKEPILYAQAHFFQGSIWMGQEKYLEPYWEMYSIKYPDSGASQSPEIIVSNVSDEAAGQKLPEYDNPWMMYTKLDNRTLLESKLYAWCQKFSERYPSALNVYYEDDEFVCYYFRQDGGEASYNLALE